MGRRFKNTEEFILRAMKMHPEYNYDKVVYKGTKQKVQITCSIHGDFLIMPSNFLLGRGCQKCGWTITSEKISFNTEEFIKKSIIIHENKYDYSKTVYVGINKRVIITCPEHGDFTQTPSKHLQKRGCSVCGRIKTMIGVKNAFHKKGPEKTTEEFIKKANEVHKNKYSYINSIYLGATKKITINCLKHGEFSQTAINHLTGRGCNKCRIENFVIRVSDTLETFIKKANKIHKNYYNYSKVNYIDSGTKIIIICPKHGEFYQTPNNHISGRKCAKCSDLNQGIKKRLSKKEFMKKAREIHGDKYKYIFSDYENMHIPIRIICKKHGEFKQTPDNHLIAQCGCPKCSESKGEYKIRKYLELNSIEYQNEFKIQTKNGRRFFDFYIKEKNLIIEFHGQHHYYPVSFGSSKKDFAITNFKNGIKRDYEKEQWCIENKIDLLIIPYWQKDMIKDVLDFYLENKIHIISEIPKKCIPYISIKNEIIYEINKNNYLK